jgi:hypothetical protein
MNLEHLTATIEKLWPGKFTDPQMDALTSTLGRLDLSPDQAEAVCNAVFVEPSGKVPLATRIVERLKFAARPSVRETVADPNAPRSWARTLGLVMKFDGDDEAVLIEWHRRCRDKSTKVYGHVSDLVLRDAYADLSAVMEHDEQVWGVMSSLFGEAGEEYTAYRRGVRALGKPLADAIRRGGSLAGIVRRMPRAETRADRLAQITQLAEDHA